MSEWISTGQMIDTLKVGEVAECKNHDVEVTKDLDGRILVLSPHGSSYALKLDFHTTDTLWRIKPKYVSFEEAMKEVKEGKTVWFHPSENSRLNCNKGMVLGDSWFSRHTFADLVNGKWTIE